MLYLDESALLAQGMATLKEKIDSALARAGMIPAELGRQLGYVNGFQGYHDIFVSRRIRFSPKVQARVIEILKLERDYFDEGNDVAVRERATRQEFEKFRAGPLAQKLSHDMLRTLEHMKFMGPPPTARLYTLLAMALLGYYSDEQVEQAIRLNEEVAKTPAPKPRPKSNGKTQPVKSEPRKKPPR
jgi:hypothetical protein